MKVKGNSKIRLIGMLYINNLPQVLHFKNPHEKSQYAWTRSNVYQTKTS